MRTLSQNPRSLFATLILAGAAIAYVTFIFLPGQSAIGQLRRDLHEKQQFIVQAERLTFAIQQAEQDLEAAQVFTQQWRENSPSPDMLPMLLGDITRLARQAGTNITKLEPQSVIQHETIWHASVAVHCTGDFQQVFEFLRGIERLSTSVWISHLQIELASRNGRSAMQRQSGELGERGPVSKNGETVTAEIALIVFADKDENSD